MNIVSSVSSRQNSRRIEERRNHCRRENGYAFGSDDWIRSLKESYLLWPKEERRQHERRYISRRHLERRALLKNNPYLRQLTLNGYIRKQGLTDEEKDMLEGLMLDS